MSFDVILHYCYLSSLSIVVLSAGLFFFGRTGGHTFPQMSSMLRLIWQLRVAALVRIRSIAVIPSPWAWRFKSISSSHDADREFCLEDSFWWSFIRSDSMLSRISKISVTSWGGELGGTQRVEELLGLTTWAASVLLRLIISWNFLLRSATRLKTWASRRFWQEKYTTKKKSYWIIYVKVHKQNIHIFFCFLIKHPGFFC